MSSTTYAVRAGLALGLAALAAPSFAGSVPSQSETVITGRGALSNQTVTVTDGDLAGNSAQSALVNRYRTAATVACAARPGIDFSLKSGFNYCQSSLVADARNATPTRAELASAGGTVRMIFR